MCVSRTTSREGSGADDDGCRQSQNQQWIEPKRGADLAVRQFVKRAQ
jgi:hypothetical protein